MDRDDDGSNDGDSSSSRPRRYPFLRMLYAMVDDPLTDSIVSWSQSGKSFIVWNESEFCSDVLPKRFMYMEMSGFTRCLGIFGFRKVESEQWEYADEYLVRGKPELISQVESFVPKTMPEFERSMERLTKKLMTYRAQILHEHDKCLGMDLDDGSNHGDSSSRPHPSFLGMLYEMVDDPSTDSIVSWSESGKSFIVWNESEFCSDVLPRCLVIKEISYFTRWLELFGFEKVEPDEQWEYAKSDYFVRGKPELTQLEPFVRERKPDELKKEMERQMKELMAYRA